MIKQLEWPTVFIPIVLACLCLVGIVTLLHMFSAVFLQRGRHSRVRKTVAAFGTIGLLSPAAVSVVSLINNEVGEALSRPLWPTFFVLGAGEYGDPVMYIILVFAAAILSNVGLYGLVGLLVGGVCTWIRAKQIAT
jgi:hypothetical protein